MKKMGTTKPLQALNPQRIVVLRALQLGDLMCLIPSMRALRDTLPHAVISLIGLPWARSFVERYTQYFDDFIEFPGFPGFPEITPNVQQFPKFLSEVQWLNFDLAIQMQGSGNLANSITALLGSKHTAGFYLPGQYYPEDGFFLHYPSNESEIRRLLRLVEFLGAQAKGEHLEFPLRTNDWEELHDLQARYDLTPGTFAVVHPGARSTDRRWPVDWFAEVANGLAARGLQVVLTGTAEEENITAAVIERMNARPINLTGQTSLGGFGALLCQARLLVSNDTGVSHIADALRIPSVVLFTGSDPQRWAPLDQNLHRVIPDASSASPEVILDEADDLLSEVVNVTP